MPGLTARTEVRKDVLRCLADAANCNGLAVWLNDPAVGVMPWLKARP